MDIYARQGVKPVASALGNLFGSGGGADDDDNDDPLVYVKPKDPLAAKSTAPTTNSTLNKSSSSSTAASTSAATTTTTKPATTSSTTTTTAASNAPSYIYATSVQALFTYNVTTRAYDPLSKGPTGCVIVGSGTQYSLMFYDANKTTLCMAPITPQMRFILQPGGGGRYFMFSNVQNNNTMYSVACSNVKDTVTILTHIAATAAHSSIHHNDGTVTEISCTLENGPETGKVANKGDNVTVTFTLRAVTTVPSAKPTDILTAPPIAIRGDNDARTINLSNNNRGIARIVSGLRPGDHRVQIIPLPELFGAGDIDAGSVSGGVGMGLHGGGYVFVDCHVVNVTTPVAPVVPAKPTPESLLPAVNTSIGTANAQPLPVETPAPAPASSSLFSNTSASSSSLFGSRRNSRADSVTHTNDGGLFDSNDRGTPNAGMEGSDNANMRDRMARLALAGRNGAAIPVIAQTEGGLAVQSIDAVRGSTNYRSRSNTSATQGVVSSPSKDDHVATPVTTISTTTTAPTVPTVTTAPVQPALGLASLIRPPLGTGTATNPTGTTGNPALFGMGLGFNPLTGAPLSTVGAYGQLGMMNALGLNNPLLNLNNANNGGGMNPTGTGGNVIVPGMDGIIEGVKELRNSAEGTTNILNRMDGKLDKLLASVKASSLVTSNQAPVQPQLTAKQLQLLQQQQIFGLSSTASTIVIGDNESEDNTGSDNLNDDMSVVSRTGGSANSTTAGTVVRIPDLLRQLTAVLNTASDAQRKIEEKTNKVAELRKDLTAARKDHDDALDTIDRLTATRAKLMREDTVLRNEKVELEEQIRNLTKQLAEAQARAEAGEEAAAASSSLAKQARLEVIQANEQLAEVRASLTASQELAETRQSALEASHNRIVELENALQGKHEEVTVSKEEKERLMHSVAAERAALLEEMSSKLSQANAEAAKTMEEVRAIHVTEIQAAKNAGYKDGFAEGEKKGYHQGHADGHREGYNQGYSKGRTEGHNAGYQEGLANTDNGNDDGIPSVPVEHTNYEAPTNTFSVPDLPDIDNGSNSNTSGSAESVPESVPTDSLPEITVPVTDDTTARSVTKIQSVTRGYFDRKRSQALKLEKQRLIAEAEASAREAREAQARAQAAMEAAAQAEKEAQEAEAEKQRQQELEQQQQEQEKVKETETVVSVPEPIVATPPPPAPVVREINPQAHINGLAKFYEDTRPEFANTTKASELHSKLGTKIWEMLGSKYGIEKVVKVAIEYDLVFPNDPIYAAITSAVESLRVPVVVEPVPTTPPTDIVPENPVADVPVVSTTTETLTEASSSSSSVTASVTFDDDVKAAAVRIQAVFRGTMDRKRITAMKAQLEAAELAIEAEAKLASAQLAAMTAQSFSTEDTSSSSTDVTYPPSLPAESGLFYSSGSLWSDPPALPSTEFSDTTNTQNSHSSTEFLPPPPPPPIPSSTVSLFSSSYDDNDDSANVPPPVSYEDTPTAPVPRSKLNSLFGSEANDDDDDEEEVDVFAVKKPVSSLSNLFGASTTTNGGLFSSSTGDDDDNNGPPPPPEED